MLNLIPVHSFKEMGIDDLMAKVIPWTEPPKYNIEETHAHDFYELMIFKKGGGEHTINYRKEKIKDCSIHVVARGSTHLSERNIDSAGYTIAFSEIYISQLQQFDQTIDYKDFYKKAGFLVFKAKEFNELLLLLNELINNEQNRSYFLNLLASILCKIIILNKDSQIVHVADPLLSAYNDFLNDHYLEKNVLDKFIESTNYSKLVINRSIKKITGLTPLQLHHKKIHLESARLLYNSNISIKEIANMLNFEDESYFCRFFRSWEGLSPKEFRKKYK